MEQAVQALQYASNHARDREQKFLTFRLANEEYGIEILKVKEIIGMMPITSVPRTPNFYKGVLNLRGKVIPVVDLRLRFGMEEKEYTLQTCIVVVEVARDSTTETTGIVVDAVSEVVNIRPEDTEEPPSFGDTVDTQFISAMAKTERGVKILLDIDRVLATNHGNGSGSSPQIDNSGQSQ